MEHLLFRCPFFNSIDFASCWSIQLDKFHCDDLVSCRILVSALGSLDGGLAKDEMMFTMVVFWYTISNLRNKSLFNGIVTDFAIYLFENLVRDFALPQLSGKRASFSLNSHLGWEPFPNGWLKINTDVAIEENKAAFAMVVRYSKGVVAFLA